MLARDSRRHTTKERKQIELFEKQSRRPFVARANYRQRVTPCQPCQHLSHPGNQEEVSGLLGETRQAVDQSNDLIIEACPIEKANEEVGRRFARHD